MNSERFQHISKGIILLACLLMITAGLGHWYALSELQKSDTIDVVASEEDQEGGLSGSLALEAPSQAIVPSSKALVSPEFYLVLKVLFADISIPVIEIREGEFIVTHFQRLFRTSIIPKAP